MARVRLLGIGCAEKHADLDRGAWLPFQNDERLILSNIRAQKASVTAVSPLGSRTKLDMAIAKLYRQQRLINLCRTQPHTSRPGMKTRVTHNVSVLTRRSRRHPRDAPPGRATGTERNARPDRHPGL